MAPFLIQYFMKFQIAQEEIQQPTPTSHHQSRNEPLITHTNSKSSYQATCKLESDEHWPPQYSEPLRLICKLKTGQHILYNMPIKDNRFTCVHLCWQAQWCVPAIRNYGHSSTNTGPEQSGSPGTFCFSIEKSL